MWLDWNLKCSKNPVFSLTMNTLTCRQKACLKLKKKNLSEIKTIEQAFSIKNNTDLLTQFISADKAETQKKEKLFCPKQAEMPSSDWPCLWSADGYSTTTHSSYPMPEKIRTIHKASQVFVRIGSPTKSKNHNTAKLRVCVWQFVCVYVWVCECEHVCVCVYVIVSAHLSVLVHKTEEMSNI